MAAAERKRRAASRMAAEERAKSEPAARRAAAEAVAEELLLTLPRGFRDLFETEDAAQVERVFRNPMWASDRSPEETRTCLDAVATFKAAEVERRLATSDLRDARDLLFAASHRARRG